MKFSDDADEIGIDPYRDDAILHELCNLASDQIETIFDGLEVDLKRYGRRFIGPCPVHGGDSPSSCNVFTDGFASRGNWVCHSKKCHKHFTRSFIGFVRGVMSHAKHAWSGEGDQRVSHRAAVDEICRRLGIALSDVKVDRAAYRRRKFDRTVEILSPSGGNAVRLCSRESFRRSCRIPAPYYLGRGYRQATLEKFEVGECTFGASPNFGRILIPIYDVEGIAIIGALSRSQEPRCDACGMCHVDGVAPCPPRSKRSLRWVVEPEHFVDKHHLYNLWRSRNAILKSKCVVITEGAGDVWRLDEAGIVNSVALFGSRLSPLQDILLEECGPRHVVILTDDDEAGNSVAEEIANKWRRLANVHRLKPEGSPDVGGMTTNDVRDLYRRRIESWMAI